MKLHEAVKGHIVAHSKGVKRGGLTTIENTVLLHKVCNKPVVEDNKEVNGVITLFTTRAVRKSLAICLSVDPKTIS